MKYIWAFLNYFTGNMCDQKCLVTGLPKAVLDPHFPNLRWWLYSSP